MIKRFLLSLSFAVFSLSCSAADEAAATYQAGTHYDVITPALRSMSSDKIEVAEFFWYGCGHCFTFEPMVKQWKKNLPEDVSFRGIPAIWQARMDLHARAYFAAEALGVLDKMHMVIFDAMNVDKKQLGSPAEIRSLFVANGVSAEDFDATFNSFGVSSQVRKSVSTAKGAKIAGTPSMMVNGKYHVSTRGAGSQAGMLQVVDFLIAKERAEKGS